MTLIKIICGPTASGKSALAVAYALQDNGVVINADSMQVYNALPRLTAQPTSEDMAQVPHRLYAYLKPNEKISAQIWRNDAVKTIESVLAEGKTPVIVGGTGLYIKTLVEGLSSIPDIPSNIREKGNALQHDLGNPAFHTLLSKIDPVLAQRLNPNDTQRLIRAWEVFEATGKSLSYWQSLPLQGPPQGWGFDVTILTPARSILHSRCDQRFESMIEHGVMEEVEIAMPGIPPDAPIGHALGYRPLRNYLLGAISRVDAIEQSKAETRQYAKRQDTWFRHQIRKTPAIKSIKIQS